MCQNVQVLLRHMRSSGPPSLSQQDLGNSPGIYDIIVVGIQDAT